MWITGPAGYVAPDKAIQPADVTRSDARRSRVSVSVTGGQDTRQQRGFVSDSKAHRHPSFFERVELLGFLIFTFET